MMAMDVSDNGESMEACAKGNNDVKQPKHETLQSGKIQKISKQVSTLRKIRGDTLRLFALVVHIPLLKSVE